LDQHIEQFANLQILNLSFNHLESIMFLPPNLQELHVASNSIRLIKVAPVKTLIHLGLSYNKISDCELSSIARSFPNLFSIDLSYNDIVSLQSVVDNLKQLASLKLLDLKSNPVCLTKNYRPIVKQRF
jgi:Leucine-rich repeat (LRR) protein